ncbi:MAG: acyl-CoA reductase [Verrucomicrobiota bacterium]
MNLSRRLQLIAEYFGDGARIGFSGIEELERWVVSELGDPAVLDGPVRMATGWQRVRPVGSIYHICAGNIAVSAETSLLISILLGSRAVFKLPATGLPELEDRIQQLPQQWQQNIQLIAEHDPELMQKCDAVVVFGSDETVASVTRSCAPAQRVLHYGYKMSVGVVTCDGLTESWAQAAVDEILAYQQLGCLSPQSYLCADPDQVERFAGLLAAAFKKRVLDTASISLEVQARIYDARQRAAAAVDRWIEPQAGAPWTVVLRQQPRIQPGPGYGFIEVVPASSQVLPDMLEPWKGKLSSVSFSCDHLTLAQWNFWEKYGVHRFCPMGYLQRPPVAWPHDGRPRLADLVTWTFADPEMQVG